MTTKKLIEVALPLEKINASAAAERYIHSGHPFQLHLWWARRPLATSRAVIWASLVDDPSSHPELYHTEEDQNKERQRLFKILEDLVEWENTSNQYVLNAAKREMLKSTNGNLPELLDPFAGGGAIPLEGHRLGLKVFAHDLNPVPVLINKALIEIPPMFSDSSPVNPDDNVSTVSSSWLGAQGLAADISYYGNKLLELAKEQIGYLYQEYNLPRELGGGTAKPIAWIWTRTVDCSNPACNCRVPLVSNYILSNKKGREVWVEPVISETGKVSFIVRYGKPPKNAANGSKLGKKATFICPKCKTGLLDGDYIDKEAHDGKMGVAFVAVVGDNGKGRVYSSLNEGFLTRMLEEIDDYYNANKIEEVVPHEKCRGTFASNAQGRAYCFEEFKDYYTKRQLIALTTLINQLSNVKRCVYEDALNHGLANDHLELANGGTGALAYSEAITIYLSFVIDKIADYNSALCHWQPGGGKAANTFNRQAISMAWDFTEANIFADAYGGFLNKLDWTVSSVKALPAQIPGRSEQFDAQLDAGFRNILVSTDPPYYDNVCYSDLSDFFYVWLRKSVGDIYPNVFKTLLVPKSKELIANPYRHEGNKELAKVFFEEGMSNCCKQLAKYTLDEYPITIYYAYKQNDSNDVKASSGWETMLSAIINAGLSITGTWPIRTELANRTIGQGTNALASSIVLVCRKRILDAPQITRRNFINILRRELRPALKKLQDSNIAPVDLAQSAIGPGMGVFSRYSRVLEADGTPMSVRSALHIINEEIDLYFNEQVGDLDAMSRFCVDLFTQNAFNDIRFGDADVLARAKGTSVATLVSHNVVYAKAGTVHLVERTELPENIDNNETCIWMLTQQLTQAMATGGVEACAKAVFMMLGSNAERAKDLAYRLYTIAEQKKWSSEAFAYNALVVAWPDIQSRAAVMQRETPEQMDMFSMGLLNT